MGKKKQVKKVQISIPEEQYQKVENLWLGLGFSSIAEAAKFLLMDNVNEFYKQTKKSQKAVAKLKDLKKKANSSVAEVAHVQPKVRQSGKALSANQQTSGYIKKSSIEYERIIAQWQKQNQDFVEPPDVNGLRWSIDEKTNKRKVEWWKNGSK